MSLLNTMPLPGRQVGNVLVVDDEPELRSALRRILVTAGHSVLEARSASEALAALSQSRLDVVVLDLGLPDGSGFDVLKAVKASGSATSVLVFTASNASEDMHEALRLGAAG